MSPARWQPADRSTGRSGAVAGSAFDERTGVMNDRILWGQIGAVGAIVTAAIWTATQWTAASLGFQPELGAPWFRIDGYPVYPPPAFFWWWFAFDAYAPAIFLKGAGIRSEERRVGKECVSPCRSRWSPDPK